MAQQVRVKVSIDGEILSPFAGINIAQDIHRHHTFEVALSTDAFRDPGSTLLEQSKKYIGKECHISFGGELFRRSESENEFTGVVTEVGLSRFGNGDRSVVLRGHSPTVLMDGHPQCRSFTDVTLKDMVEASLTDVPQTLQTDVNPQSSQVFPYVVQYNESNYDFIQRLAATYGEWCYYDGTRLIFGQQPGGELIALPLVKDLFNFDFTFRLLPVHSKTYGHDYVTNQVFESQARDASLPPLDEYGQFSLEQSSRFYSQEPVTVTPNLTKDQPQLNERVAQHKAATARDMVMMSGNSDNPHLNAGTLIDITGEATNEHDHGKFIITSVSHSISGTLSYQNSFSAIPAEMQLPPPPTYARPLCESQRAVVSDNQDPDKLGRIQVQFPWQASGETTPWLRSIQPYAGRGDKGGLHGFHFIPEVGTEVLVGFEHDNPDRPFVLGNVYHGESAPQSWYSDGNAYKVIRTRNGNEIRLVDSGGKEKIHIYHRENDDHYNEIRLEMEGEGTITIETKGQLDLKAKNISLQAEESISMQAGIDVKIEAEKDYALTAGQNISSKADKKMTISSGMDYDVTAGKDANISANGDTNIDGAKVSIKADASLSAEALGEATLDGGVSTKVSSKGNTVVKGLFVKIN